MTAQQQREQANDAGLRAWGKPGATVLARYTYTAANGKVAFGRCRALVVEVAGELLTVEEHRTEEHGLTGKVAEKVLVSSVPRKRQGVPDPSWRPLSKQQAALKLADGEHPTLVRLAATVQQAPHAYD